MFICKYITLTGLAHSMFTADELPSSDGEFSYVELDYVPDMATCYVVEGGTLKSIPYPPNWAYTWNGTEWIAPPVDVTQEGIVVRERRDSLLSEVDVVVGNPLRWAELSESKQAEWAAYRQALLDVPQQAGFPLEIVWPTKPQ